MHRWTRMLLASKHSVLFEPMLSATKASQASQVRARNLVEFLWFVFQSLFCTQELGMPRVPFLFDPFQSCEEIPLTLLVGHDLSLDLFQLCISFVAGHHLHITRDTRDPSGHGFADPRPGALDFLHKNPGFSFHYAHLLGLQRLLTSHDGWHRGPNPSGLNLFHIRRETGFKRTNGRILVKKHCPDGAKSHQQRSQSNSPR